MRNVWRYAAGSRAQARQRGAVAMGDEACAGAACPVIGGGVGARFFPNLIRARVQGEKVRVAYDTIFYFRYFAVKTPTH